MNYFKNIPAFKTALIFAAGIYIGCLAQINQIISAAFVIFVLILLFLLLRKLPEDNSILNIAVFFLIFSCGFLKSQIDFRILDSTSAAYYDSAVQGNNVILRGVISEPPQLINGTGRFLVNSEILISGSDTSDFSCNILVHIRQNKKETGSDSLPILKAGDRIIAYGNLRNAPDERNPGEFNYRKYLELQDVYKVFYISFKDDISVESSGNLGFFFGSIIYPAREFAVNNINQYTGNGDEAAFLNGLVTGNRSGITKEMKQIFVNAGVMHLIAVSGLNVAYIIITVTLLLSLFRIPKIPRIIITVIFLLFYCFFAGSTASIVRAVIMGSLVLTAFIIQRKTMLYNIIGVSVIIILLIDSRQLFDPGFILSYTAVLSMVFFFNIFDNMFLAKLDHWRTGWRRYLYALFVLFLTTLAAQIGVLPITAMYFNKISFISLLANILAVPLSNLSLAIGFFQVITGIFSDYLSSLSGSANFIFLKFQLWFISWCASLDFAYIEFYDFGLISTISYYIVLITIITAKTNNVFARIVISCLVIAAALIFTYKIPGGLEINYLFAGNSDCTVINTPDNSTVLVDCGIETPFAGTTSRYVVPYLKSRRIKEIDALVLSNPLGKSSGNVNIILNNFIVKRIITCPENSDKLNNSLNRLDAARIPEVSILTAGDIVEGFGGIKFYIISRYDRDKNGSLVFKLKFRECDFLFSGKADKQKEELIIHEYKDFLKCQILKAGDQGDESSASIPFLVKSSPESAVISVSETDYLPSDILLERINNAGIKLFRTDINGAFILESSGKKNEILDWK
ncbi:MAG: DNA internalization-related competence protein ComEC/Rec2 [Ignavibacteriae bacterium]|nr:DNA internalization-related competence protein ComEC/Rec2 [Ignavibacteriota bacterium]